MFTPYFFRFGRWVNAEPAAVLAALLAVLLRRTLDAAVPARLLVVSLRFLVIFPSLHGQKLIGQGVFLHISQV